MKQMTLMRGIGLGIGMGMAMGMAMRNSRKRSIQKSKVGKTLKAVTDVMEEITDAIGLS
jgi:hypothetical protein